MYNWIYNTTLAPVLSSIVLSLLLFGCGGSDDNPDNPTASVDSNTDGMPATGMPNTPLDSTPVTPSGSNTSAIAGLWDLSGLDDEDNQDVVYALISSDGLVTEYDYDQDAAGSGRNCYIISASTLTADGNNQYSQSDEVEGGFDKFTAIKNGSTLAVSFVDIDDDNENGSTTDLITEEFNELVGVDPTDLNDCNQLSEPNGDLSTNGSHDNITVGGFNVTRGGDNSLDAGAYRNSLEENLAGVSILTTSELTEEFLNQVDVFLIDAVKTSSRSVAQLSLLEVSALENFVESGGGLIVASDNPTFQAVSNSFLQPFGLTAGGIASGGPHTAAVIDRSTFVELTDGSFGRVNGVSANNIGSFSELGLFSVIANWESGALADSPAIVARSGIGSGLGRIVAVGDHQTITPGLLDSEILFLNAISFVTKGF